jgi:hypothetical protein
MTNVIEQSTIKMLNSLMTMEEKGVALARIILQVELSS